MQNYFKIHIYNINFIIFCLNNIKFLIKQITWYYFSIFCIYFSNIYVKKLGIIKKTIILLKIEKSSAYAKDLSISNIL